MRPVFADIRRRLEAVSKVQFVLNLGNVASRVYQVGFAVYVPVSKYMTGSISSRWLFVFAGSLFYSTVYPLFPKPQKKKWIQEEVTRAKCLSVGVSQLASGFANGQMSDLDVHKIRQRILLAMQSEIQELLLDTQEMYVNVSLMVDHPADPTRLMLLNRTNPERPDNATYPKENMVVWRAMLTGSFAYEPNFKTEHDVPYRSILGFPILIEQEGGIQAIGGISIDSSEPNHFAGLERRIETKLLPYISVLKLTLIARGISRAQGV